MTRQKSGIITTAVVAAMLLCLVPPADAQEEEAVKPAPELGNAPPTTGAGPQTLSEIAGSIKLQQPPDDEKIVISNSNLRQVGAHGWLSVTGTTDSPVLGAAPLEGSEDARAAWEESYNEQAEAIKRLEDYLQDVDAAIQAVPDPYREGRSPHNYAPGQQKTGEVRRNEVEAELALERARLDRLHSEGRRLGVTPDWYSQQKTTGE